MALDNKKVGFIGSGAMAEALLNGILQAKVVEQKALYCSDVSAARLESLKEDYGINVTTSNEELVGSVDIVILSVKPFVMADILEKTAKVLKKQQLVISIAAGITIAQLERFIPEVPVIRVMPNTPSLIGMGAAAMAMGTWAKQEELNIAEEILSAVGKVVMVKENLLDGVTGLSGSGPAYIYLITEAFVDAGVRVGLPRDVATTLAIQTIIGSAKMVEKTGLSPAVLKEKVTTPGGTTIVGLHQLEEGKLRATIMNAVMEATKRSQELSN